MLRSYAPWMCSALLAAGLAVTPTFEVQAAADCDASLCVVDGPDGARWEPDAKSTKKNRKRRNSKLGGTLSLTIDGGRGSVFINGRYAGTAPIDGVKIPRGKNDVQVRDGEAVLATGLLTVPKGADVSVTVSGDGS